MTTHRRHPLATLVTADPLRSESTRCDTAASLRHEATQHLIERELKFFVPLRVLRRHVSLKDLPRVRILQHYFPRPLTAMMGVFAAELSGQIEVLSSFTYSQARLRQIVSQDGHSRWYLQAKGRLPQHTSHERIEVSAQISEHLYADLRELAGDGSLEKNRYQLHGSTSTTNGSHIPATCEIDIISRAGIQATRPKLTNLSFATIDLELPSKDLIEQIRAGQHSFSFLRHGCELTASMTAHKKFLSTRRLARKGLDRKAYKAVAALTSRSQRAVKRSSARLRG